MCVGAHTAPGIPRIAGRRASPVACFLGPASSRQLKGLFEKAPMNFPVETKPAVWGVIGGAIAATIVGFSWGGWVTGCKAENEATTRANAAVVAALAPVCVERFRRAADLSV